MERQLTIVAIGDDRSEKTALLVKYTYKKQRYKYSMPSRFTNNYQRIIVDGAKYMVYFMDTDNDEDYLDDKREAILKADCFLFCYSIKRRQTYDNLINRYIPQVRILTPNTPSVIVGIGTEARSKLKQNSSKAINNNLVTFKDGDNLRARDGSRSFVECSVEYNIGIDDVFIEAIRSTYDFHKYLYYSL